MLPYLVVIEGEEPHEDVTILGFYHDKEEALEFIKNYSDDWGRTPVLYRKEE